MTEQVMYMPRAPMTRLVLWHILRAIYPITFITWIIVDFLYRRFHPLYLDVPLPYHFAHFQPVIYKGDRVVLGDGTEIVPGARIIEIHIDPRVVQILHAGGVHPYDAAKADLARFAAWLAQQDGEGHPLALHGQSILHGMMRYFDAEIREKNTGVHAWFEQLFQEMTILLFHPRSLSRLQKKYMPIADGWISCKKLLAEHSVGRVQKG